MSNLRQRPYSRRLIVPVSLVTLATLFSGTSASAALPAPLQQAQRSMLSASSYRETINSTTATASSHAQSTSSTTVTMIHHGRTAQLYIRIVTHSGGQIQTTETLARTGQHACIRRSPTSPWQCILPDILSRFLSNSDSLIASLGMKTQIRSLGSQNKNGQSCLAYSFNGTVAGIHSRGTIWISALHGYPVAEEGTGTGNVLTGSPVTTSTTQTSWSDWNSASLRVPSAPASPI